MKNNYFLFKLLNFRVFKVFERSLIFFSNKSIFLSELIKSFKKIIEKIKIDKQRGKIKIGLIKIKAEKETIKIINNINITFQYHKMLRM